MDMNGQTWGAQEKDKESVMGTDERESEYQWLTSWYDGKKSIQDKWSFSQEF